MESRRPARLLLVLLSWITFLLLLYHIPMPAVQSRLDSHLRDAQKFGKILEKARTDALKSRGYSAAPTRARIRNEFTARNNGMLAHEWQVNIAEALHLGLDCSLIAGTGAGKTMPFVMPLFADPDKVVIVISPLNALEVDQASRFRKMGLSAVAVNGDTYSPDIHKEIEQSKHRVIITSPDMCLQHDKFRQLLSAPAFAKQVAAFVIDEAHCISQWGDNFRPEYSQLGTLRAFVPLHVPFLFASATLPPLVLAEVRKSLHFSTDTSYHVNLGNDRPNIAWFVQHMNGAKSDLDALNFIVPPHDSEDVDIPIEQSMVFIDDINLGMEALEHVRDLLPPRMRGAVALYHSRRSKRSKRIIMEKFRAGEIKILLTTEAAGMGCDLSHIQLVVQFMVPDSLSIWMQRAGRAGRNFFIAARAVLLVQPSVFKEVKSKNPNPADEVTFQKSVEDALRTWIETEECRRDVADNYFDNGIIRISPTGTCCDNCLRKLNPDHALLGGRSMTTSSTDSPSPPSQYRREQHLKGARDLLTGWRADKCATIYRRRPWGPKALMPDEILTKIAMRAHLKSTPDLIGAGWGPTHAARHGEEVLSMLADFDAKYRRARADEIRRRAEAKKAATAQRKQLAKEQKAIERAEKLKNRAAAPKKPRKSRAKANSTPTPVLQPSASNFQPPSTPFHAHSVLPYTTPFPSFSPSLPEYFPEPSQLLHSIIHPPPTPFTPTPITPNPFVHMHGMPPIHHSRLRFETPTPNTAGTPIQTGLPPVRWEHVAPTSFYGPLPPAFIPGHPSRIPLTPLSSNTQDNSQPSGHFNFPIDYDTLFQ
ncbi:P-loop containing nucleoside triphosphate hydrolase protein, partial [Favolaschia claudopus]